MVGTACWRHNIRVPYYWLCVVVGHLDATQNNLFLISPLYEDELHNVGILINISWIYDIVVMLYVYIYFFFCYICITIFGE